MRNFGLKGFFLSGLIGGLLFERFGNFGSFRGVLNHRRLWFGRFAHTARQEGRQTRF